MTDRACPSCGAPFKRPKPFGFRPGTPTIESLIPIDSRPYQPGDLTICTECNEVALNLPDDQLRKLTPAENAAVARDPRVQKMRALHQQMRN